MNTFTLFFFFFYCNEILKIGGRQRDCIILLAVNPRVIVVKVHKA